MKANPHDGETPSTLLKRISKDAYVQVASNIRTMIENVNVLTTETLELEGNYSFSSLYDEYTKQSSVAEIAGLNTETHFDEKENTGYAFSYVNRTELISFYSNQIDLQLRKIEDDLALASSATVSGQKMKAKSYCEKALDYLTKAEFSQELLSALSPGADIQLDRYSKVKNELFQKFIDMEQNIYIYLKCDENNFDVHSTVLSNKLKSILADNHCSFTTDAPQADYIITINADTRQHDIDNPDFKFAYADIRIDIFSNYKQLMIFSDELSVKGGAMTYTSAGKKALEIASKEIWTKIEKWILK